MGAESLGWRILVMVTNRATREYLIEWETSGLSPGYYDLYLSFENMSSECMQIELISPAE